MILRGFHPPQSIIITKYNTNAAQKESLMGGGGGGVHIRWQIWTGGGSIFTGGFGRGGRRSKIRCNTGTEHEANYIE